MKRALLTAVIALLLSFSIFAGAQEAEKTTVKNIFIFISDGMGYNHEFISSQWYTGKDQGFGYQNFSFVCGMSNYSLGDSYNAYKTWSDMDTPAHNYTDSAAAATAMSTGQKTYDGAIGVDKNKQNLRHIFDAAKDKGMSTGVVSSVEFSHATPAGFVAHNESRNNYADIAKEMLESDTDVIMGAGHPLFDNDGKRSNSLSYKYAGGQDVFKKLRAGDYGKFITARKDFVKYMTGDTPDRLIGLARVYQTLQYNRSADFTYAAADVAPFEVPMNEDVPTLEEMTRAAINVLDNNEKGFIMMVEGGAVDWAGHGNFCARMVEEQIDFVNSVDAAIAWVAKNSNWDETLIIVTADHETGYLLASGAGTAAAVPGNKGIGKMANHVWKSGNHTNQLVPFYAEGKAAKRFSNYIVGNDPVRGHYIDNVAVARMIFKLLGE
jgi:alkaline phosphatase